MAAPIPHVVSITIKPAESDHRPPDRFSRVTVDRAELVPGHGIAGDAKGRPDSRQLNIMFADAVEGLRADGFRTAPGELGEQLVIAGISGECAAGTRLRIGDSAVIQVVYPRVPCGRFARIHDRPKDAARGRIGFMARVLIGGPIGVGSSVVVVANELS